MATNSHGRRGDTSPTVYVKPNYAYSPPDVYHTDPNCPRLTDNPRTKPLDALFDDIRECKYCSGDIEFKGGTGEGHLESLKRAARADD